MSCPVIVGVEPQACLRMIHGPLGFLCQQGIHRCVVVDLCLKGGVIGERKRFFQRGTRVFWLLIHQQGRAFVVGRLGTHQGVVWNGLAKRLAGPLEIAFPKSLGSFDQGSSGVGLGLHGQPQQPKEHGESHPASEQTSFGDDGFQQEQHRACNQPRHEVVLVIHVTHGGNRCLLAFLFELKKRGEVYKSTCRTNIRAASGLCGLEQGGFVQTGYHGVSIVVISKPHGSAPTIQRGNGGSLRASDSPKVNARPLVFGLAGSRHHVVLVVFSIGEYHNHFGCLAVFIKARHAQINGGPNGSALGGNHVGVDCS